MLPNSHKTLQDPGRGGLFIHMQLVTVPASYWACLSQRLHRTRLSPRPQIRLCLPFKEIMVRPRMKRPVETRYQGYE